MTRFFLIIVFLILCKLSSDAEEPRRISLTFLPQSTIVIKGKSNISEFSFSQTKALAQKEILVDASLIQPPQLLSEISLNIPLSGFRCKNPLMLNDFLNVTRASEYPNVVITIHNIEIDYSLGRIMKNSFSGKASITITLANKSKPYTISFTGKLSDQVMNLNSSVEIAFSDFNIDPPTKLGGLIKVKNQLIIELNLSLKTPNNITLTQSQLLSSKEINQ